MADKSNTLSAKLEVRDSFTSALNKFSRSLNSTETAFNKFVTKMDSSAGKIEKTLDRINTKIDSTTKKIVSKTESVTESINKSTQKTEQQQKKLLDDLTSKYTKFGSDVSNVFKNAQQEANKLNPKSPKSTIKNNILNNKNAFSNDYLNASNVKGVFSEALKGNFTGILGKLGLIGSGIIGAGKILSTLNGWAQQGFNTLNTISTGLLSIDGLKEGIQEAGQFQNNRVALDTLYKSESIGQQYYQIGTKAAKKTPFSESEVGALQKKLAGANVNYSYDDLLTILDMASVKPELGADHAGFSIVDAMAGRTTSLKTNYMIDNKEVQAYLKEALSGQVKDKTTGKKVDASKWKKAFNSKGSVDNKQEYLDLLLSYIRNKTNYNGLTEKYAGTINGQIDRLKGNWETLKADLLGVDANGTGMMKPDQVTVFSSFQKGMKALEDWLDTDKAEQLLNSIGESLGTALNSVADAFIYLLNNVNWTEVGNTIKTIGKDVSDLIQNLVSDGTLDKLLKALPDLVRTTVNNEVIKKKGEVQVSTDLASGNAQFVPSDLLNSGMEWLGNILGVKPVDESNSKMNKVLLTDANADTVLSPMVKNNKITENQKNTIEDMMKKDNTSVYNIKIDTIQANDFNQIVDSIKKVQNNK